MPGTRADRRAERAAVRADRSGSGPVLEERPPARFPGAAAKFALFGEVLLIGLLVLVVGALIVTLPVALAAGIRHLGRYVAAEDSRLGLFWRDVRVGLAGGAVVGLVALVIAAVLGVDILLARTGMLPGGVVIEAVGWTGLAALAVALLVAAGAWEPTAGWRQAVRDVPAIIRGDVRALAFYIAAVALVVILTWMLPPLLPAALGCAVLAVVAVPHRRR
ncbi:hypothetical protein Q9S71_06610 [Microbacterium sp. KSW4-11]|uniref:Poxvirus protein I5 n=1 Tax=Microbacterium gawkjiense TaxID=3067309 RepID=A0ABU3G9J1_9MICO|nr:hypothetical protein [Microbacterium sp. KSW4-11]MDT3316492.1 hypothetical protein [Microbacterium sp. KSW4-11]